MRKKETSFSASVTREVIRILRTDGKMPVTKIAEVIGKSNNTVYNMAQGKATLSADEYGKLVFSGSLPGSVLTALRNTTMEDVKKRVSQAGELAKKIYDSGSERGIGFSKAAAKKAARTTGRILQAAGDFIKAFGGDE